MTVGFAFLSKSRLNSKEPNHLRKSRFVLEQHITPSLLVDWGIGHRPPATPAREAGHRCPEDIMSSRKGSENLTSCMNKNYALLLVQLFFKASCWASVCELCVSCGLKDAFTGQLSYRVVPSVFTRSCLQSVLFALSPDFVPSSHGYPGSQKETEREERQDGSPSKVSTEGRRSVRGATWWWRRAEHHRAVRVGW